MKRKNNWWKEGVVYQIYPRSFKDTTGNGLGDLQGVIEKLDYIKSLGVNMIWICPVYESPNRDNGYDISDYKKISHAFGGNETFERLVSEMHKRDLKIIMDLVVNHTSDEHPWFKQAKTSKKNEYYDYYIWRKGKNSGPPNNWQSVFSGDAWSYNLSTNEYYLHLFTKNQPDLNWENPKVREEVYDIIDFWLSKGVDGLRMDVISLISKRNSFSDVPEKMSFAQVMEKVYANGPKIHKYLKEMNSKILKKYDIVTVGEGPGINLTCGPKYVAENEKELNMIFHFDHLTIDFGPNGKYDPVTYDFIKFKEIFSQWDKALENGGWNSIFLGNHDFSRIVSRFGNDKIYREESAKLLITLLMTLRGTPYIYQGDEIGMTNISHPSIDDYNDVESLNAWEAAKKNGANMKEFLKAIHWQSRDNARTPMQWTDKKNGGFTTGNPWIKLNKNYKEINVENSEKDKNSILNYYRQMISFRKKYPCLVYGSFKDLLPEHDKLFFYERIYNEEQFLIIHNFSNSYTRWKNENSQYIKIKSNYKYSSQEELSPWESRIYKLE
jgi:oligo-1,6-glucosidase